MRRIIKGKIWKRYWQMWRAFRIVYHRISRREKVEDYFDLGIAIINVEGYHEVMAVNHSSWKGRMMKMVHFPKHMGLKPRRFDKYDGVCLRYFEAFENFRVRKECERELKEVFGSGGGGFDYDYSHGRNLSRKYKVVTV